MKDKFYFCESIGAYKEKRKIIPQLVNDCLRFGIKEYREHWADIKYNFWLEMVKE